ncbi:TPA: hypothetical protein N0F65_012582 [Lagenidium giganteum]|uniref:Uncharacterized protein n=1 Tax=Lagenidium giganteum TaxID=4803 RepID=A0AAV2YQF0_9STRA|nr:TPA: hypothetical protein N0F65_012582 [Lagenidium giganteum]
MNGTALRWRTSTSWKQRSLPSGKPSASRQATNRGRKVFSMVIELT